MNLNLIIFFVSVVLLIASLVLIRGDGVKKYIAILLFLVGVGGGIKSTIFQVDEGELMVLTQFKKIHRTVTTPGIHFRFPWIEVYTFPKRINSFTETISGRSLDGLLVTFEITPFIRVDENHLENIYREIAKNYEDMQNKIILPAIRNITRTTVSEFNAVDVYNNRRKLADQLESDAKKYLKSKYIIMNELQLRKITLPKTIEDAIQAKLEKQQKAESIEFDKLRAQKEAEVKQIEAKGLSKAQAIINATLTTKYIQFEAVKTFQQLAANPNKTFIIAPTSPNGTGMPLILNSKN